MPVTNKIIGKTTLALVMWAGFLCKRGEIPFAKEKNRAAWLESEWDFPLKAEGKKFPAHMSSPELDMILSLHIGKLGESQAFRDHLKKGRDVFVTSDHVRLLRHICW
jgi:hypothetical protein